MVFRYAKRKEIYFILLLEQGYEVLLSDGKYYIILPKYRCLAKSGYNEPIKRTNMKLTSLK